MNGGGVRITISRWFTPDHNSVAPDGDPARHHRGPHGRRPRRSRTRSWMRRSTTSPNSPTGEESALDPGTVGGWDRRCQGATDSTVVGIVGLRPVC